MATTIVTETWYALSQVGKVVKQGGEKESVLSEEAFYYVRYIVTNYNTIKYYLFNTALEPTTLKYNGIVGKDLEFIEKENKHYESGRRKTFFLKDKSNQIISRDFGGSIEAFKACILFMDELGNYGSLKEMKLAQQVDQLQVDIQLSKKTTAELETKNKELQSKLDSIYESKSDLRKLTQLLFENENYVSIVSPEI